MSARLIALLAFVVLVATGCTAGPSSSPPPAPGDPGLTRRLVEDVTADGAFTHLKALQDIADRNGGNRAAGTPGYEQSVDYVAGVLRGAGYQVETPRFTFYTFTAGVQSLTVGGRAITVRAVNYSASTLPTGLSAPLAVLRAPGCGPGDYDGRLVAGAVVLADRGSCTVTQQQQIAAGAGAAGLLVASDSEYPLVTSLDDPSVARIPTGSVSRDDADTLVGRAAAPVTLTLVTRSETKSARNVISQTVTGRKDEVVLSGAHLDSVSQGPGINDNGSSAAAQLELALQLGPAAPVTNVVRFAWWGAEEEGLWGSSAYVGGLSPDGRRDIAVALNSEMLGSPNAGYFVYAADGSDGVGAPGGAPGAAGIERTLLGSVQAGGETAQVTGDLSGRSDQVPFAAVGIPVGGLFGGAEGIKTAQEAALWGGTAGEPYDGCYHRACDTIDNVDRVSLAQMIKALSATVGTYAVDLGGPNGVPRRDQRSGG